MSQQKIIRDGILERVKQIGFFAENNFGAFRSTRALQIQPHELPYCGVYMLPEEMDYDGHWNQADIKFKHMADIGISVIFPNVNEEQLENTLDAAFDALTLGLLSDPTLVGFQTPYKIEGITKMTRDIVYGMTGGQNEQPIGELRLGMTFIFRFDYPPDIRDVLETVHLRTIYPSLAEKDSLPQTGPDIIFETE